jgi:hypothetical protein
MCEEYKIRCDLRSGQEIEPYRPPFLSFCSLVEETVDDHSPVRQEYPFAHYIAPTLSRLNGSEEEQSALAKEW